MLRNACSFVSTPARRPARVIKPSQVLFVNHVRTNASAAVRPKVAEEAQPKVSRPRIVTPTAAVSKEDLSKQIATMSDDEVIGMVDSGKLRFFNLENDVGDYERAVHLRRTIVERKSGRALKNLPYQNYNYDAIHGQCCENVIGVVGIPVGVAGPLIVDGKEYFIPMATTEGALIASTTRGCKAISVCGGASTELINEGMTRAPVLQCPSAKVAAQVKAYVETNFEMFQQSFNSTSRFARLKEIKCFVAGRKIYLRFKCITGDAMGMNMTGKGVDQALALITDQFENVEVLALSGNVCTDKKPSAINWIEGRGKSVIAEAVIRGEVVESVLKSSVASLVELNYAKNLLGSAVAGSIGGLNAHASNVVTAMFLATGQDPAQNVESSTCITIMEPENNGKDLYVSVTMPSLEVGTVGGGTSLPGQSAMLELLGVKGSHSTNPGENSRTLARVVASTVMAGELSLMSALSSGHLISSHLKLNRKHGAPAAPVAPALNLTTPLSTPPAATA